MTVKMNEEQMELFRVLTPTQKMVVIEVVAGSGYIRAWRACKSDSTMSDKTAEGRVRAILKHPKVKKFMDSMNNSKMSDAIMSKNEALERLTKIGRANIADLVDFGKVAIGEDPVTGAVIYQSIWVLKDSALQSPEALATIAELVANKEGLKIKQHSPLAAIKQLSEALGWDAPKKHDLSSKDGSMSPAPTLDPAVLSKTTLNELLKVMKNGNKKAN